MEYFPHVECGSLDNSEFLVYFSTMSSLNKRHAVQQDPDYADVPGPPAAKQRRVDEKQGELDYEIVPSCYINSNVIHGLLFLLAPVFP